jgi:hypothetical protein
MSASHARLAAPVIAVAAFLAAAGCSSSQSAGVFQPAGGGSSATADGNSPANTPGQNSFIMPPFGKNVHIEMTHWLPKNPGEVQAVLTDKDFELAYLYSEYTGGEDQSWNNFVSSAMASSLQPALQAPGVTTESFVGTIRYFDMTAIRDPLVHGDLDVSMCFDNAGSSNTNVKTGAVLPDNTPAAEHFVRLTDQVAKNADGQWQVVANLPAIYYPRAKECKP